jgi:cyanophycin synthetase
VSRCCTSRWTPTTRCCCATWKRGGRAVYLQDNSIVLANGARHEALLDVRSMPVTLNGAARYNIANSLAAAAALSASGFGNAEIVDGLRTFVSDWKHNPLRSNVFDVDGVTVIVDYAHNARLMPRWPIRRGR